MANLLKIQKKISFDDLYTDPVFTRDDAFRIIKMEFTYTSVKVTYDVTYIGNTTNINTYTRTIEDI